MWTLFTTFNWLRTIKSNIYTTICFFYTKSIHGNIKTMLNSFQVFRSGEPLRLSLHMIHSSKILHQKYDIFSYVTWIYVNRNVVGGDLFSVSSKYFILDLLARNALMLVRRTKLRALAECESFNWIQELQFRNRNKERKVAYRIKSIYGVGTHTHTKSVSYIKRYIYL